MCGKHMPAVDDNHFSEKQITEFFMTKLLVYENTDVTFCDSIM